MNNSTVRPCHVGMHGGHFAVFYKGDSTPLARGFASYYEADEQARAYNLVYRHGWRGGTVKTAAMGAGASNQVHDVMEIIAVDDIAEMEGGE